MNKQLLNNWKQLKYEYKYNLKTLEPETGLKDINKFAAKVNWALNEVEELINTETELTFKVEYGNAKLPRTTLIATCGTWFNCPGRVYGFCEICKACYDKAPEIMFKKVIRSRMIKELCFRTYSSDVLSDMISKQVKRTSKLVRFNEVGEIRHQQDLIKLINISDNLHDKYGLLSYVYTHNKDLKFTIPHDSLRINTSNFEAAGADNTYKVLKVGTAVPTGAVRCICDCHNCNICTGKNRTIYEYLRE